ncbi:hypothetical protein VXS06_14325, partial [Photobacterium toruni]|nr:hypothetical protein [Photobacterium toruni]
MSNIGVIYAQHKACRVVNKIDHLASPLTNQQVDDALNSGLILESCSLEDIEITLFNDIPVINDFMLEAISCKKNKVNVTISAFGRALDKELVGAGITADYRNAEVSSPRKVGLAAIMTAKVALSDGQSVSIVFHAPDDDPFVIKDQDTLIAFRFLLNSRDITHVVAPQGGSEISLIQVTKNIGNVVTANTEKFKSKQAENLALKAQVDGAVQQGEQLESEIALINEQEVKLKDAIAESNINIEKIQKRIDKQNVLQEKLQAEIDSIKTVIQEPVPAQEPVPEPTTSNSNTGTVIDLDTVPLSSVKTASVLNPTIKANATDGDDAIWYVQGKPSGIVDDSNRDFYTALNKAKTLGFHLVSYKHSRLQGIYVLQNDNDEVLTSKGFNKIKAGVKDAATPEPTPEPVAKYWYGMRIRPIGFGTQPDGHIAQMSAEQAEAKFPDFTERDYRYGAVGYAEQLTPDVIEHYNLTDFQKVVSVDGDIDTAEVTIEDAILAKLKSLKVNGFTQNEIDTYLQAFDSAKGTNKDKIQSLFSKELRQDFFFVNRKT